jgi:hypothetical protein
MVYHILGLGATTSMRMFLYDDLLMHTIYYFSFSSLGYNTMGISTEYAYGHHNLLSTHIIQLAVIKKLWHVRLRVPAILFAHSRVHL